MGIIKVNWHVEKGTFGSLKEQFKEQDIKFRAGMGFDPTIAGIVVGVTGLIVVLKMVRSLLKDCSYCGYIIDVTKDPINITEMKAWERNQVLIISNEGPSMQSFDKESALEDALKFLKNQE